MEAGMLKIAREYITHCLNKNDMPAAYMESGECVEYETYDCYQAQLLAEGTTFGDVDRKLGNPATGPVYINGAEPGDVLKITIEQLEIGEVGILDIGPNSGALKEEFPEPVIKRLPIRNKQIIYNDYVKIPIKPMIGVIGTAPAGEGVSTMTPMNHGGNMDCTKIQEGSILYLPVFTKGGLLSVGDFHAIMGDGEVANCGVEIEGKVKLKVDILKDFPYQYPMLENEKQWMTIAYGDTLDEASEKAVKQIFHFLCKEQKLLKTDAGMLIDMAGDLIVCQIVNPYKTVRIEVPKWLIKEIGKVSDEV